MTITISVVIPVYRGEYSLSSLLSEIEPLTKGVAITSGEYAQITEVLLVHDCGPDRSDRVIESLAQCYDFVRPVWLTQNYGQHAATLAGMASASGDWIVTIDEDGQQNPKDIIGMLDFAIDHHSQVVYASPVNPPPHGFIRNACSIFAKKLAMRFLGRKYEGGIFNSFRLIDGEIGRIMAAYCGNGIYLDVAIYWMASQIHYCPVTLRAESRPSGYSAFKLFNHFWRMVLCSGTGPLRLITFCGGCSVILSFGFLFYAFYGKFISQNGVQGWTSLMVIIAFFSGMIMVSLGVVAEYLALTMGIVIGKPLYIISSKPTRTLK